MSADKYPPIDYVRQCVRYEDGKLFWRERPRDHFPGDVPWRQWNAKYAGKEAGSIGAFGRSRCGSMRRCTAWIASRGIYRHLIVWAIHNDEWRSPIDHRDRDSLNDRIENLRPATESQDNANRRVQAGKVVGLKGVSIHTGRNHKRFKARITVNKRVIWLGLFATAEEAHAAYVAAAREHFGEFACEG